MTDGDAAVSPTIECGSPESVIIEGHGNNGENDGEGMPGPTLAVGRPADLIIQLRNLHLIHLTTNLKITQEFTKMIIDHVQGRKLD